MRDSWTHVVIFSPRERSGKAFCILELLFDSLPDHSNKMDKKIEGMTLPMVPNRIAFSERFGCVSDAFISCDFQWMQQWTESPMINMKTIISDMKQREHQGIFQPNVEANFISLCSTVSIDLRAVIMVYLWSTRHH